MKERKKATTHSRNDWMVPYQYCHQILTVYLSWCCNHLELKIGRISNSCDSGVTRCQECYCSWWTQTDCCYYYTEIANNWQTKSFRPVCDGSNPLTTILRIMEFFCQWFSSLKGYIKTFANRIGYTKLWGGVNLERSVMTDIVGFLC